MAEQSINPTVPQIDERPLVTFALFAYNQEKYIREAVEGAFAQTYEPLEIILSDDCSTDRTFEIIQEMAAAYKGAHRIVLNRCGKNRGLGAHINNVLKLCSGKWIIVAAGDDVSLPERTVSVIRLYQSTGEELALIHSAAMKITECGTEIGVEQSRWLNELSDLEKTIKTRAYVLGATAAWSRRIFEEFSPLPDELMYEDQVFQVRALLKGRIGYIERPLVMHRLGGVTGEYRSQSLYQRIFGISNERWIVAREQIKRDLRSAKSSISVISAADNHLSLLKFRRALCNASSPATKASLVVRYVIATGQLKVGFRHLILSVFPNISEKLFNFVKSKRAID